MPILDSIPEAIEIIRSGGVIIVVDDEDRENEGDFLTAARNVTPDIINFMATHGRGLICAPLIESRCDALDLELMVTSNNAAYETPFTVSVDLIGDGCTTGISASDRSKTIKALIDPATKPDVLGKPGHIFPLRATEGGVLRRAGHTEAAIDLCKLADLQPAGVICEILSEDGTMARAPELMTFAKQHKLKIITIEDLIAYRLKTETLIRRTAEATLPTMHGQFQLISYESITDGEMHTALHKGEISPCRPTLVRVHSQCLTGDVFGSLRCDCGEQLDRALAMISQENEGILLYMRQEGRGMGLGNKIRAYQLQDQEGLDTVEANEKLGFPADLRDYGIGAQILRDLGVRQMKLLTNNPRKISGLHGHGLEVVERIPLQIKPQKFNLNYLNTKRSKLGHLVLEEPN